MFVKITYFVHGTTTDNEKEISSGWFKFIKGNITEETEYWLKLGRNGLRKEFNV